MFGLPCANMLADIASVAEKLGNESTNVQYAYEFATGETYLVLKTNDVTRTQESWKNSAEC